MNNQTRFTREILLYSLILILALTLRLSLLGRVPLVDPEASLAFQAYRIQGGETIALGSQTAYLSITGGVFKIFGSGDFQSRLWPALSGSLLVLAPFLVRKRIGQVPALVLAAGFAIDPALVSVSRMIGSPMTALVYLLLALAALDRKKLSWALLLVFLALFSGPALWLGAGILAITGLICSKLGLIDPASFLKEIWEPGKGDPSPGPNRLEEFLLPGLLVLTVGSFFFTRIQGLGSWLGGLAEFFQGWVNPSGFHSLQVLIILAVSSPLILIFGGLGFLTAWKKNQALGKFSTIWFGIALLVLLIYPGRQAADLVWLVIPLWVGAARELVRIFRLAESSWPVWVLAGLVGVLLTLNWLTFTGLVFQLSDQRALLLHLGLMAASLALAALALTMVASERGWPTAQMGLGLGSAAMLLLYLLSVTVQEAYLKAGDPRSLWSAGSGAGQMDLMLETIGEVSLTQTGRRDSITGSVIGGNDSLRWELRSLKGLEYFEVYHPDSLPPILITAEGDQDLIPQYAYRGQDFLLRSKPGWTGLLPQDWISWIAYRKAPLEYEKVILWVRGDILAGNE